jgi:hypothetical protein
MSETDNEEAPIMADKKKRTRDRPPQRSRQSIFPHDDKGQIDHPLEKDPAVERGERIDTGKTIHRGGKHTGHVPGATERMP